jgi:hypothetical protein
LYEVRRYRKADAIGDCIGLGIDRGQCWDTNEFSLQIDQCPAAIAGIHGSIGLDGVGNCGSCRLRYTAVEGAHDTPGGCLSDPQRIADCQHLLTHDEPGRVANLGDRHIGERLNAYHGQVIGGNRADQLGWLSVSVVQNGHDALFAADDMVIGYDVTLRVNNDS